MCLGSDAHLVLSGVTNKPLCVCKAHIAGCCPVSHVVGNDFDTVILPDADTAVLHQKKIACHSSGKPIVQLLLSEQEMPILKQQ